MLQIDDKGGENQLTATGISCPKRGNEYCLVLETGKSYNLAIVYRLAIADIGG